MTPLAWFRWIWRTALLLIAGAVIYVMWVAGHICWVAGHDDRPDSDAIVVLGAAEYNGTPTSVFAARLQHALALWHLGVAPRIITVGGGEPGDVTTEAQAGRAWLLAHGVRGGAVDALPTGHDTLQNVRAVAGEMKARHWRSAVVVTDPWNSLRARTMLSDQGIADSTSPAHAGPAVGSTGTDLRYVARETEAYIYYQIFGNDNEHAPGAV